MVQGELGGKVCATVTACAPNLTAVYVIYYRSGGPAATSPGPLSLRFGQSPRGPGGRGLVLRRRRAPDSDLRLQFGPNCDGPLARWCTYPGSTTTEADAPAGNRVTVAGAGNRDCVVREIDSVTRSEVRVVRVTVTSGASPPPRPAP